ncbi:MAG: hemolysin [Chloroflexi bacterium RBG_16_48_8]|nr:MAG: hemolysin [Chloroflexi bacterium RBG_16_48_8]
MARKERIDILLVERGLAESRAAAQRFVMAGQVRVEGQVVIKSSKRVPSDVSLSVDLGPRFVSRGGEKLAAALEAFNIDVSQRVCADVGASTGGFTDCLIQMGATRVYAIDVGQGQLHWRLRNDPRVVVMERQNARYLEELEEHMSLVTIDVSFISLGLIFPPVTKWLKEDGQVIALVKPQFEAGREAVGRGGIVRDRDIHRQVLQDVIWAAKKHHLFPRGLMRSPLLGPKGNIEFLLWLLRVDPVQPIEKMIDMVLLGKPPKVF